MIKGHGIDLIEIRRIQEAMDRWGENFLKHILTDEEIRYCRKYKFPAQHIAARFAAKEAIFKAVSDKASLGWKDIIIKNNADGKPYCIIDPKFTTDKIHLSISHSKNYAVASAIISS